MEPVLLLACDSQCSFCLRALTYCVTHSRFPRVCRKVLSSLERIYQVQGGIVRQAMTGVIWHLGCFSWHMPLHRRTCGSKKTKRGNSNSVSSTSTSRKQEAGTRLNYGMDDSRTELHHWVEINRDAQHYPFVSQHYAF